MMTLAEIQIATALARCSFLPGSWDKRFARNIAAQAQNRPELDLTERQIAHLLRLTHKYRRQLPTAVIESALDEMERQADRRVACGLAALPDFTPARQQTKPKKARQISGMPALPLFESAADPGDREPPHA